jgi:hypothetical protein
MINSISSSAGVQQWAQQQPQRTAPPAKPAHHQKQDSVQLSQQAQKAQQAGDVDHDGDSH